MAGSQHVRRRRSSIRIRDPGMEEVAADYLGGDASRSNWTPRGPRQPRSQSRSTSHSPRQSTSSRPSRHSKRSARGRPRDHETDSDSSDEGFSFTALWDEPWKRWSVIIAIAVISYVVGSTTKSYVMGTNAHRLLEIVRYTAADLPSLHPDSTQNKFPSLADLSVHFKSYETYAQKASSQVKGPLISSSAWPDWKDLGDDLSKIHNLTGEIRSNLDEVVRTGRNNTDIFFSKVTRLQTALENATSLDYYSPSCASKTVFVFHCLRQHPSECAKVLSNSFFEFLEDNPYWEGMGLRGIRRIRLEKQLFQLGLATKSAHSHVESLTNKHQQNHKGLDGVLSAATSKNVEKVLLVTEQKALLQSLQKNTRGLEETMIAAGFMLVRPGEAIARHPVYASEELSNLKVGDMQLGFENLDLDEELRLLAPAVDELKRVLGQLNAWNFYGWLRPRNPPQLT